MKGLEVRAKGQTRAEVFIYDAIGEAYGGVTAKMFSAELRALGQGVKTLDIYVNSPGGNPFDALAIFNVLSRFQATKNVYIDGVAASAASIPIMAGDRIEIASNATIMIHDPYTIGMGNASDFRELADKLDRTRNQIIDTYLHRATVDQGTLVDWMAAETWMDAQEAVDAGFADTVGNEVPVTNFAGFDLSKFHNTPRELVERIENAQTRREFVPKPHPRLAEAAKIVKRLGQPAA